MLFPTLQFAVFFAVVYPMSWLLARRALAWKIFILLASYLFYGMWDWRFVSLLIFSSIFNYIVGRVIASETTARRPILALAVIVNLGILGLFKYFGFFIESLNGLLRAVSLPTRLPLLEVVVPVGISFFTFMALSYVIDLYRRKTEPVALLDFAVFLAFFPHLVAGPIVRAAEFLPQLWQPRRLEREEASRAILLIAQGLFKKVVISSYVATTIVDPVFALPDQHSALEILLAIYGYAIQIYADFSGYTDMAIGIALLLGIRFPQNFNRPYTAYSIQDFWRRWHMTLSNWLRDYLYIPLGGNRHGRWATYRNLLITMTLGGLWHGAAWTFIIWGVLHGIGLMVERWFGERQAAGRQRRLAWQRQFSRRAMPPPEPEPEPLSPARIWLGRLATFHFVCIGWVFFRAESFGLALEMLWRSITAWGPAPLASLGLAAVIAGSLAFQYIPSDLSQRIERGFVQMPLVAQGAVMGLFLALTIALGPTGVAPFIYYQF